MTLVSCFSSQLNEERELIKMILRYIGVLHDVKATEKSIAAGGRDSIKDEVCMSMTVGSTYVYDCPFPLPHPRMRALRLLRVRSSYPLVSFCLFPPAHSSFPLPLSLKQETGVSDINGEYKASTTAALKAKVPSSIPPSHLPSHPPICSGLSSYASGLCICAMQIQIAKLTELIQKTQTPGATQKLALLNSKTSKLAVYAGLRAHAQSDSHVRHASMHVLWYSCNLHVRDHTLVND